MSTGYSIVGTHVGDFLSVGVSEAVTIGNTGLSTTLRIYDCNAPLNGYFVTTSNGVFTINDANPSLPTIVGIGTTVPLSTATLHVQGTFLTSNIGTYNTNNTLYFNNSSFSNINNITARTFIGSLTGNATTATTATTASSAGTVTTAAQPNITSVGTLTSLAVTNGIIASNVNATFFNGQLIGNARTAITGTNVATTLQTNGTQFLSMVPASATSASQAVGTHAPLTYNVATSTLSATNISATTFTGALTGNASTADTAYTVTTAAQPNITSVGTLTSLAVTNGITASNVNATFFNGQLIGNATTATTATTASSAGTVTTAAQPNITSVGTLTSLAVTNGIIASNVNATFFNGQLIGNARTAITGTNVATTLQTNGTQFLSMVPASATSASQAVGTHAPLTYNVATSTLSATNVSATTFTGALTGSASSIYTTAITTGTQYLTFVPLATTQSGGQVLGTQSNIFYVPNIKQLNLGSTTGLNNALVPLAIVNNTLTDGQYNNIQLGYSSSGANSWLLGARYNTVATNSIFAIYPTGQGQTTGFYIDQTGITSSPYLQARTELQLYDTLALNSSTIKSINQIIYFNATTGVNLSQQYLNGPLSSGVTSQIGDGTAGTELILSDIPTAKWGFSTTGFALTIWNDNGSSIGNVWNNYYYLTKLGINYYSLNTSQRILLDSPIINCDSKYLIWSPGPGQTLNNFVTVAVTSIANSTYTITAKISGFNPFGKQVIISRNYAFNFILTATATTSGHTQTPTTITNSATLNGVTSFGNYTFNATGLNTAYSYNPTAASTWTIYQPIGQITLIITPNNTGNEIDTYVFTLYFNKTQAFTTPPITSAVANSGALGGSFITLFGTGLLTNNTRTSGTGTIGVTATPTNTLLTTAIIGSTNLIIDNNVIVTATTVNTTTTASAPGTIFYPALISNYATSYGSGTNGQSIITDNGGSLSVNYSTNIWTFRIGTISPYFAPVTQTYGSTSAYLAAAGSSAWVANTFKYKLFINITTSLAAGTNTSYILTGWGETNWFNSYSVQCTVNGIAGGTYIPLVASASYYFSTVAGVKLTIQNISTSAFAGGTFVLTVTATPD